MSTIIPHIGLFHRKNPNRRGGGLLEDMEFPGVSQRNSMWWNFSCSRVNSKPSGIYKDDQGLNFVLSGISIQEQVK